VPAARPKKPPPTLRDWVQPVLVTTPAATHHVANGLAPRRPPPRAIRWVLARRRKAMDWIRRRRHGPEKGAGAKEMPPASPPAPDPTTSS
jgi:hypothetical protein